MIACWIANVQYRNLKLPAILTAYHRITIAMDLAGRALIRRRFEILQVLLQDVDTTHDGRLASERGVRSACVSSVVLKSAVSQ